MAFPGRTQHLISNWAKKLIVALQAFVDDSRSEQGDKTFVLAAYVHDAEAWMRFSDDWAATLAANPSVEYLHMVEAHGLRDQFEGWDRTARDRKLEALGRVIDKHQPWSLICSVSKSQYDEIVAPVAPYNLKNPYFACFYALVLGLPRIHKARGLSIPVDFVFDEQLGLGSDAAMFYEYMVESSLPPDTQTLLGSTPIFRDDRSVLPLQAADMLAWHVRRMSEKRTEKLAAQPFLRTLKDAHYELEVTEEILRRWAEGLAQIQGVGTIRDRKTWQAMRPELRRTHALRIWPGSARYFIYSLRLRISGALRQPLKRFKRWLRRTITRRKL